MSMGSPGAGAATTTGVSSLHSAAGTGGGVNGRYTKHPLLLLLDHGLLLLQITGRCCFRQQPDHCLSQHAHVNATPCMQHRLSAQGATAAAAASAMVDLSPSAHPASDMLVLGDVSLPTCLRVLEETAGRGTGAWWVRLLRAVDGGAWEMRAMQADAGSPLYVACIKQEG